MSKNIFLCYRLSDAEIVDRVKADLAHEGIDGWSYTDVMPGQSWRKVINQALVEAETVIIFLSPSFLENEICRQQVYIAQSLQKRIIPIFIHVCFELLDSADEFSQLKGLQIIPINPSVKREGLAENYDALFRQLVEAIQHHSEPIPLNAQHNYVAFSKLDTDFVITLEEDLNKAGINIWSVATHSHGGDPWRSDIAQAVQTASHLVLVLSLEAIQSYWVRREILLAQLKDIPIIPIIPPRVLQNSTYDDMYPKLRDTAIPIYEMNPINDINWIYPEPDYDKALRDLTSALKGFRPDTPRKQGIFISYRRSDSRDVTGRAHDFLAAEFGADFIFQDVGSIQAGENFVDALHKALEAAAVMLVMIGSTWTTVTDDAGNKRLHNPDDFVRLEVQTALERKDMVVIPVLLDATLMPTTHDLPESLHSLLYRQNIRVRPDPDFRRDMSKVVAQIRESQS